MDLKKKITRMSEGALEASRQLLGLSCQVKDRLLLGMADEIMRGKKTILAANRKDVASARSSGCADAFVDRLSLNDARIKQMADSLVQISALADPVGEVIKAWRVPNGLWIHKVRVPIGVVAIIYESRPNVTSDCAGLCLKSGNSVILRGGSEALNSNIAIYGILKDTADKFGLPVGAINIVDTRQRAAVEMLLKMDKYIDLVIPRGGESLIKRVVASSRIPVIKHYKGVCHVYVDEWADLNKALEICFNAKVQRPGVCNAMETLLVHQGVAARFLPGMLKKFKQAGVRVRGCAFTVKIGKKGIRRATDKDYYTEYLGLELSVKVVRDLDSAIAHINHYGTRHSDAIVTEDYNNALKFLRQVDSACVYANASTRFTDGNQFGMGAEIGISTDKLHARGPMGLEELTTYKYMVFGDGQVRTK